MTMDAIQNYSHNQENRILKRNLWKFFKILRAQANPIYGMLEASPINFAWITIIDKSNPTNSKRIPISKFVGSLKKMPSTSKYYQLNILANEIIYINELSIENVKSVIADAIIKFESKQSHL